MMNIRNFHDDLREDDNGFISALPSKLGVKTIK